MKTGLQKNIEFLCYRIKRAVRQNGSLNIAAAAREIGITQTTLMRAIDGSVAFLTPDTEKTLSEYFNISAKELYDDDLIEMLTGSRVDKLEKLILDLTPEELLELKRRIPGAKIVLE